MADERAATSTDIEGLRSDLRGVSTQITALTNAQADGRVAMAHLRGEFIALLADTKLSISSVDATAKLAVTKAEASTALAAERAHSETSLIGVKTLVIWSILAFVGSSIVVALISKFFAAKP